MPGVRSLADLDALLPFLQTTPKENDYAVIGSFTPQNAVGNCVYCNHCQPCPAGIDVGLVNKYYDLSRAGDRMAHDHYGKLAIKADVSSNAATATAAVRSASPSRPECRKSPPISPDRSSSRIYEKRPCTV